jgi:hypothetical protein
MRILIALPAAVLLAGCATVTRGTTSQVTVNSEPAGASAKTSLGHTCTATPCTFEIPRKSEFIVTFEKEGYDLQQIPVATRVAGSGAAGFAGNVLLGGVVGMGVDAATGSTLEHYPNPVFATLQASGRPGAKASRTPRPKAFKPEAQGTPQT